MDGQFSFTILVFFAVYRNYYLGRKLKKRENEVIQSEEKYKGLFENSLDAIAITNLDGEFVEVNRAFERMTGYSRDEIIGMSYMDLVPREYSKLIFESYNKAFRAEENIYGLEFEFLTKSGKRKYVEGNISLIKQGGSVVAFQGNFRDVTEKKRIENALRDSEEMFRKLAEKSLVGIYLIQDGVFKYVNPKMAKLWGYSVGELIGKSPLEFIHPEDREIVRRNLEKRVRGEIESINYRLRMIRKDGKVRHNEVFGSRVIYRGKPAIIGSLIDVTERLELEKAKLKAFEQIERNIENYAILVDQIRNPLAIISGITEMKLDGKNRELRELREVIMDAVKRIEDVVSKLDKGWLESETIRDFLRGELVGEVENIETVRWGEMDEKRER